MAADAKATSIYVNNECDKHSSPYNLLDNSYFIPGYLVNQRGFTSATVSGYGYTIDRWMYSTNKSMTISVDSCLTLTNGEGSGYCILMQRLVELPIGVYTLAIKTEDGVYSKVFNISTTTAQDYTGQAIGNNWYININTEGTYPVIRIFNPNASSSTIKVYWMVLYEGEYTAETLPEYQPKGYAAELLECQRYFVRFGMSVQNNHIGYAQAATSTVANAIIAIPLPMRIYNPTLTVSNGSIVLRNGISDIEITSMNVNSASSGPFMYVTISGSGFTVGATYVVRLVLGTIDVSAEL